MGEQSIFVAALYFRGHLQVLQLEPLVSVGGLLVMQSLEFDLSFMNSFPIATGQYIACASLFNMNTNETIYFNPISTCSLCIYTK